ncbi:MAG: serine hydrolase [Rhodospirillaceae bacterium]
MACASTARTLSPIASVKTDGIKAARVRSLPRATLLGRISAALLILGLVSIALPSQAEARYASIVVDARTGKVLHARNADTRKYPASLTKMMTLYMLFEAIDQGRVKRDARLKVSSNAAKQPPSKLGLRAGTGLLVEHAIKSLVTKSANDVAVVVAEALGGTEAKFAQMMTKKAKSLGMTRTTFRNASGLPNRKQMSTARDMAILSMALQKHFPHYYDYFKTTSFRFGNRTITTHNRVLKQYRGADGLKTGYIRASGFNLASSASRNGQRLVAVVFGGRTAKSRDKHMMDLLDRGFAQLAVASNVPPPIPLDKPSEFAGVSTQPTPLTTQPARVFEPTEYGSAPDAPLPPAYKPGRTPMELSARLGQTPAPVTAAPTVRSPVVPSATVPTMKQGTPEVASTPRFRTWGIQVGAFASEATARAAAQNAATRLNSREDVHPVEAVVTGGPTSSGKMLYRARLFGLANQVAAKDTCRALGLGRNGCLVLSPSQAVVAQR